MRRRSAHSRDRVATLVCVRSPIWRARLSQRLLCRGRNSSPRPSSLTSSGTRDPLAGTSETQPHKASPCRGNTAGAAPYKVRDPEIWQVQKIERRRARGAPHRCVAMPGAASARQGVRTTSRRLTCASSAAVLAAPFAAGRSARGGRYPIVSPRTIKQEQRREDRSRRRSRTSTAGTSRFRRTRRARAPA